MYYTKHQAILAGKAACSGFYVVPDGDGYNFTCIVKDEKRPLNALSSYRWTARDGWKRVWYSRWLR